MTSADDTSATAVDPQLYIDDFVEMLRDILRAIAADDNARALAHASGRLRNLFAHAEHLPPSLSWYKILEDSVCRLKPCYVAFDAPNAFEHDYDRLAKYGVKLVAELTTSDGASAARISNARRAITDEIQSIGTRATLRREVRESR